MKCLNCKNGEMKLTNYSEYKYPFSPVNKTKGILECSSCGHKEVFR